jgi:flagellar motor protein MotB
MRNLRKMYWALRLPVRLPLQGTALAPLRPNRYHPPARLSLLFLREDYAMRRSVQKSWLGVILLLLLAGCATDSIVLKGKVQQYEQQQANLSKQFEMLRSRATALDKDNQDLNQLLAQTRQEAKLAEEQLTEVKGQLRTVNTRLADAQSAQVSSEKKVETMEASLQRQGSVTITPNNSFLQTLPAINLPGVVVRRTGDAICVELPAERLFEPNTNRLRPGGAELIVGAVDELLRTYPDQMIGIEGYTDSDLVGGGQWRSNHELSIAQAMTVHQVVLARTRLRDDQVCIVGRGSNNPVASNGTEEGKRHNRRVELVVYPEKKRST